MVAGGVLVGLFILIIEIIFKRYKERIDKDNEISQTATVHWKKRMNVGIGMINI
jgi:hypothetical protein